MKLILFKNQFQLSYGQVLYSDGKDYFPFRKTFRKINDQLSTMQQVLVLGSGIGSVAMVLSDFFPEKKWQIDFVDCDSVVLEWCREVMSFFPLISAEYFIQDALEMLQQNEQKYDLIAVDIFVEHQMPQSILNREFFEQIQTALRPEGIAVMNLLFETEEEKLNFMFDVGFVFPKNEWIFTRFNSMVILYA